MRTLVLDFLDRWKWCLAAGVAVQVGWIAWDAMSQQAAFHLWPLPFLTGFLISRDRTRGLEETYSRLPIPRKTQAAAYWVETVIVPTGLVAISLILAFGLTSLVGRLPAVGLGYIPMALLFSLAYSGIVSFWYAYYPTASMKGDRACFLQIVLMFVYGILIMTIIKNPVGIWASTNHMHRAYLLLGAVCLVLSWFLAKRSVGGRWERIRPVTEPAEKRILARYIVFPDRKKCLREPWIAPAVFPVCFLSFVMLVTIVICAIAKGWGPLATFAHLGEFYGIAFAIPAVMLPMLILLTGAEYLPSIRASRTLPLTGHHLALLFLSIPILACVVSTGTFSIFALASGSTDALLIGVGYSIFQTGMIALALSLGLHSGNARTMAVLGPALGFLIAPALMLVEALGPAAGILGIVLGLVLLVAGITAAVLFLTESTTPYRFVEPAPVFMPPGTEERISEWDREMKKRRKKQES